MNKKTIGSALLLFAASAGLTACGGSSATTKDTGTAPEAKKEPFTLSLYAAGVSPQEFDTRFRKTLETKFPHITFKYRTNQAGATITELVSQGDIPDLIRTDIPTLKTLYMDLGLAYDMRDLIKKNKYDMTRFNSVFTQEIVDVVRTGEVYGLPVPPYFPQVLYYNKDLFDKFGQPYPKDGMTWDEVYEVARKMTRVDGEQIYRGFSANTMAWLRDNQFSNPILDPKTDGLSNFERWSQLFTNLKRFYDIPNNAIAKTVGDENNIFSKGNVAMQVNQHNIYLVLPPELNWDIVSTPVFKDGPKLMGQRGPAYWSITQQSKHKDEAFQVIMEMLSDEIQMEDSRNGIPTVLTNKDIQAALGKGHPLYSKKNMNAVNFYPPAAPTPKRQSGLVDIAAGTQQNLMANTFQKVATNQADINSALREADEQLKKEVEKEKSK
ncbi:ABC transporter substrate-binding protein [Paenibacillus sp. GYB003]|uniref:ABC transporter substrate-binding protein n=1 Tax=Paenibacillus sp. GYB003 TaxID=2994392 RepID=UPI002F966A33